MLGGAPQERQLHYTFAYEGFPGQFFAASDLIWKAFKNVENQEKMLKEMWGVIAEIGGLHLFKPEGLTADFREFGKCEIVTIIMPEPKYIPEAYYCIIIKDKETSDYKYYTVEKSFNGAFLGKVAKDSSRQSIGDVFDTNLDSCIRQILQLHGISYT